MINFPEVGFNLNPYILSKNDNKNIYDLFGIINHYGSLGGGHYTAFAKNFQENIWAEFDDSHVSRINKNNIVTEGAYVLFYRRRDN